MKTIDKGTTAIKRLSAALAVCLLTAGAALAEESAVPRSGQDSDPTLPSPNPQLPEKVKPDADASGGPTLSDKLEKSDGVLRPPGGVDPAIKTVPPQGGSDSSMPVIKPPGNAK